MVTAHSKPALLYPYAPWYFALAIVTTWIGFSFSYFSRITQYGIYHHVHGATAGLWMALLVIQPILYQRGKLALHRKLGLWGTVLLVPLLLMGGVKMIQSMIQNGAAYPPGVTYRLAWIDVYSLSLFSLFLALSLWHGKQLQLHARYITCTVIVVLHPAIGRLLFFFPWINSFDRMLPVSFLVIECILLLLIADDKRRGRFRSPYWVALTLILLLHISMHFAGEWPWWKSAMDQLASLR